MECFSSFRYFVWLGILCCLSVKGFAVEKPKEVAGKADVLRHVKKQFGSFEGIGERFYEILTVTYKSGHSSSHRASKKLVKACFDSEFDSV